MLVCLGLGVQRFNEEKERALVAKETEARTALEAAKKSAQSLSGRKFTSTAVSYIYFRDDENVEIMPLEWQFTGRGEGTLAGTYTTSSFYGERRVCITYLFKGANRVVTYRLDGHTLSRADSGIDFLPSLLTD